MRIGIGRNSRLPVIKEGDYSFSPFILPRLLKVRREWKRLGLRMDGVTLGNLVAEKETGVWDRTYLPPFPLTGKTILDIGASCGDTAKFYLDHGAKKVICIESSPSRIAMLQHNSKVLNIEIVPRAFKISDLFQFRYDFIKCDIEGWELLFIDYADILKPCVLESHTWMSTDLFMEKGFRCLTEPNAMTGECLMCNWKEVI